MEPYEYYGRCNREINTAMLNILHSQNSDIFSKLIDGYFKSIHEIIDHVYVSDILWLNDFIKVIDTSIRNELVFTKLPKYGEEATINIIDAIEKRTYLDQMILRMCQDIKEEDLLKSMEKKRRNGEIIKKDVWKALIHFFNHQTHHRGQIAEILDEMKIENNYSNMIFIE